MMTMHSILGFEGLNPLAVYYSYIAFNVLKFFVLEVCDWSTLNQKYILAHFITRWVIARTTIKDEGEFLFLQ